MPLFPHKGKLDQPQADWPHDLAAQAVGNSKNGNAILGGEDFHDQLFSLVSTQEQVQQRLDALELAVGVLPELHRRFLQIESALTQQEQETDAVSDGAGAYTGNDKCRDGVAPAPEKRSLRARASVTEEFAIENTHEVYSFEQSTWDSAVFICSRAFGSAASSHASILLVVTMLMQIMFAGVLWNNFSSPLIDESVVTAARVWRYSQGHGYTAVSYDRLTGTSLVARVCGFDKTLQVAGTQTSLYYAIDRYLNLEASGFETLFVGRALCMVALICWYMMVWKELHRASDLFRGLAHLPRNSASGRTKLEPFLQDGCVNKYFLVCISPIRLVFCGLLMLFRFAMAILLLYCGTYFLVYTINIPDLVLNAVALETILCIDGLVYDALATATVRDLMQRLEPMEMPRWPHLRGIDIKSVFAGVSLPSALVAVYIGMLLPMTRHLEQVAEELCGGNRNFVWTIDAFNVTVATKTNEYASPEHNGLSLQSRCLAEAIREDDGARWKLMAWAPQITGLSGANRVTVQNRVSWVNPGCEDILEHANPWKWYVREVAGNQSVSTCADVAHLCTSVSTIPHFGSDGGRGFWAKMTCPITCGCHDPSSPIAYQMGCPQLCVTSLFNLRQAAIDTLGCDNVNATQARYHPQWTSYRQQLQVFGRHNKEYDGTPDSKNIALRLANAMQNGCEALQKFALSVAPTMDKSECGMQKISPTLRAFKSYSVLCPRTCGCDATSNQQQKGKKNAVLCPPVANCKQQVRSSKGSGARANATAQTTQGAKSPVATGPSANRSATTLSGKNGTAGTRQGANATSPSKQGGRGNASQNRTQKQRR